MDEPQIRSLLNSDEGVSLEFKKSMEFTEAIARTICAFANTLGGYVVVGVEKSRKAVITGIDDTDTAFQKLAGIVSQLHQKPHYEATEHVTDGKKIIIIKVDALPSSEVCFLKKAIFRRVGSINEEVYGPNLATFLQQRGTLSFEENKSSARLEDLDEKKVLRLLEKKGIDRKKHEPFSMKSILASLGVANSIGDFYLKNAATLFFAKDVSRFLMNPEIRLVKFRGKEKLIETLEYDKRFSDTLPELLDTVFKTAKEKAGTFSKIDGMMRVERPMIPDEVLREALTNAVGHRDYYDPNGTLMEIYDDRIEITNPGSLLPGQTLKNFSDTRKHRNPITYRLLNDSQWGEGLNLGIKAMYRIMRKNKLPDPLFEEIGTMFRITLFGPLSRRKAQPFGTISERQKKAIEYLKENAELTAPKYAKIAGISHPTAIKDLKELVALGTLTQTGGGSSSKYLLVNVKI